MTYRKKVRRFPQADSFCTQKLSDLLPQRPTRPAHPCKHRVCRRNRVTVGVLRRRRSQSRTCWTSALRHLNCRASIASSAEWSSICPRGHRCYGRWHGKSYCTWRWGQARSPHLITPFIRHLGHTTAAQDRNRKSRSSRIVLFCSEGANSFV